jgi:hypothetical protein
MWPGFPGTCGTGVPALEEEAAGSQATPTQPLTITGSPCRKGDKLEPQCPHLTGPLITGALCSRERLLLATWTPTGSQGFVASAGRACISELSES